MSDDWARNQIEALRRRVEELEARVYALDGRPTSISAAVPMMDSRVVQLAQNGEMIKAIKLYRELTGVGLAEAKAAVERLGL